MTLTTTSSTTGPLPCNGATTVFPFNYPVNALTDLVVIHTTSLGAVTTLVLNSTFTAALSGTSGGSVTTSTAWPTGDTIEVARVVLLTQPTSIRNQGAFFPEIHESVFDRLTMMIQQLEDQIGNLVGGVGLSVARFMSQLSSSIGATLVGYLAPYTGAVARTQASQNADTISTKDFGAKGDGVTDDTAAVAAALAALTTGQTLIVDGTCLVGTNGWAGFSVSSVNGITIRGRAKGSGFKLAYGCTQYLSVRSAYKQFLIFNSCNVLTISGLTINLNQQYITAGSQYSTGAIGLQSCTQAIISENYIYNGYPATLSGTPEDESIGIASNAGYYNKYINNTFYQVGHGVWIGTASGQLDYYALISGNTFNNTYATSLASYTVHSVVSNNNIYLSLGSGIVIGADTTGTDYTRYTLFTGNYIRGSKFQGIQFDLGGQTLPNPLWTNIQISNNVILESQHHGIFVTQAAYCEISNNQIFDNAQFNKGDAGIFMSLVTDSLVTGNYCYSSSQATKQQGYGIRLLSGGANDFSNMVVSGNFCNWHTNNGMDYQTVTGNGTNLTIVGNVCNNNSCGFYIGAGLTGSNFFSNNRATNNSGSQDFRIYSAILTGNYGATFDISGSGTFPLQAQASTSRLITAMSPDRGDTSQTLVVGTDARVQRWDTTLTANRTITLSTSGAVNGDTFRIVRTGLGAFTLAVGALKTLPSATAAWAEVTYNGSAWELVAYGML